MPPTIRYRIFTAGDPRRICFADAELKLTRQPCWDYARQAAEAARMHWFAGQRGTSNIRKHPTDATEVLTNVTHRPKDAVRRT